MTDPKWTVDEVPLPAWLAEETTPPDTRSPGERAAELSHQTYGPARENDNAEYQQIVADLQQAGVRVNLSPDVPLGKGGYGPASTPGEPGSLTVNPDTDISTLGHEYEHFRDDRERGFPGMREYLQDPQLQIDGEMRAWGTEIARAEAGGHTELKAALEAARQEAVDDIKKRYGL